MGTSPNTDQQMANSPWKNGQQSMGNCQTSMRDGHTSTNKWPTIHGKFVNNPLEIGNNQRETGQKSTNTWPTIHGNMANNPWYLLNQFAICPTPTNKWPTIHEKLVNNPLEIGNNQWEVGQTSTSKWPTFHEKIVNIPWGT